MNLIIHNVLPIMAIGSGVGTGVGVGSGVGTGVGIGDGAGVGFQNIHASTVDLQSKVDQVFQSILLSVRNLLLETG